MIAIDYMDSMMLNPVYEQYQQDVAAGLGSEWKVVPVKYKSKNGTGGKGEDTSLPVAYNLITAGYGTTIKNQGADSDCWAFAITTAIESNLKKTQGIDYEFSPKKMDYLLAKNGSTEGSGSEYYDYIIASFGVDRSLGDGGNFSQSSYLLGGESALEDEAGFFEKMKLNDAENLSKVSSWRQFQDQNTILMQLGTHVDAYTKLMPKSDLSEKSDYVVMDYRLIEGKQDNVGTVKESVYKYGAAYVGTIAPGVEACWDTETSTIVDRGTNCGTENGHAMAIVGWDDEHEYTDPSDGTTKKGAFLLQNSWGEDSLFTDYGIDVETLMGMLDTSGLTEEQIAEARTEFTDFLENYSAMEYIWLGYDFVDSTNEGTIDFGAIQKTEKNEYKNVYDSKTIGVIDNSGNSVIYDFSTKETEFIKKIALSTHVMKMNKTTEYVISIDNGDGYIEAGRITVPAGEYGQISTDTISNIALDGEFKVKVEVYDATSGEKYSLSGAEELTKYWTVSVYTSDEEIAIPNTGETTENSESSQNGDINIAVPNTGMFTGEGFAKITGILMTAIGIAATALGIKGYKDRKHLFKKVNFTKK